MKLMGFKTLTQNLDQFLGGRSLVEYNPFDEKIKTQATWINERGVEIEAALSGYLRVEQIEEAHFFNDDYFVVKARDRDWAFTKVAILNR